jgi:hypothetical protein
VPSVPSPAKYLSIAQFENKLNSLPQANWHLRRLLICITDDDDSALSNSLASWKSDHDRHNYVTLAKVTSDSHALSM